jgi:hypothetical protein
MQLQIYQLWDVITKKNYDLCNQEIYDYKS